jgi:TP901 family phage tail tape measure protein
MTTEIEARLKLSAIDRTKNVFASVRRGLAGITGQAAAVNRASTVMNRTAIASDRLGMSMLAMGRVVAPAALALGGVAAVKKYASAERALTRIAITANASDRAVAAAGKTMRQIAHDAALPLDSVREGLETLVAAGKSLDEAMAMLPAVARTAQASDSALSDIASSAAAIGDSFKISAGEMENAFDILAMGGKLGKFELPDMAQYLPSLAPQFATLGYKGEEGLTKLVAMLQTVRIQTGEASTAAQSLSDLVGKMEVDDTQKRFMKFGINVRRELNDVRRTGGDLIKTFVELAEKAVGGDLSQLPLLIGDKEARRALTALIQLNGETARFEAELRNAAGTVDADVERVVSNAEASIQRLSNATTSLVQSTGRLADVMGASSAFGDLAGFLDAVSDEIEQNSTRRGGIFDWFGGGGDDDQRFWKDQRGKPGDFGDPANIFVMDVYDGLKEFFLGSLPAPLPLAAPARPGAATGAAGDFVPALPRPRGAGAADGTGGGIGMPRRRGDGGQPAADPADPVFPPAGMPLGDVTLYGDGGFAPRFGGPATGAFVADRPSPDLRGLPAVASDLVTTFGDLAAEARNFRTALAGDRPAAPPKAGPQLGELTDEQLLEVLNGREPVTDVGGYARPRGDATLGSSGGFRSDGEIEARGGAGGLQGAREIEAMGDAADAAADKLRQLPEAMRPADLAAAGQQGGTAFATAFESTLTTGIATAVRNAFAAAESAAAAGAARLSKASTFTVTPKVSPVSGGSRSPAPVHADRGQSMSELGVP